MPLPNPARQHVRDLVDSGLCTLAQLRAAVETLEREQTVSGIKGRYHEDMCMAAHVDADQRDARVPWPEWAHHEEAS
jgi:hypothetical protein